MKRLTSLFLIIALLTVAVCALAEQPSTEMIARSVVPENAELLRTGKDDGMTEYIFQTPDGMRYEVDVDASKVVKVDMEAAVKRGSQTVKLTEEQAKEALLALYPTATIVLVRAERDDGLNEYKIHFQTADFFGKAELNAETGALLEAELDYRVVRTEAQGELTADQAKELVLSLVENGRIVDFETDRDDGRVEYEGEVIANGVRYEFTIDAQTGVVLDWQMDD